MCSNIGLQVLENGKCIWAQKVQLLENSTTTFGLNLHTVIVCKHSTG